MPGRSGSADKVCPTSSPSPAAKLTGTARGNCTAKLLAANAASLASKSARCSDTDCREALTNNMPATSTFSAIRLNMMILRAKGERLSAKKPRRARRSRISHPRLVSGETKSSPNTTSPSRAGWGQPLYPPVQQAPWLFFVVAVADAIQRCDGREIVINAAQFFAQPFDMAIDCAVIDIDLIVIGHIHQLIA